MTENKEGHPCESGPAVQELEAIGIAAEGPKVDLSALGREALSFARKGWRVFPLLAQGKKPYIKGGFKIATTDTEQVIQWWTNNPNANIGYPTGEGVIVLDIDDAEGERRLKDGGYELPKTLEVKTGRGRHLYYSIPEGIELGSTSDLLGDESKIDTRGIGGYVILPSSIHENGRVYTFTNQKAELQPCPEWLVDLTIKKKKKRRVELKPSVYARSRRLIAKAKAKGPVQEAQALAMNPYGMGARAFALQRAETEVQRASSRSSDNSDLLDAIARFNSEHPPEQVMADAGHELSPEANEEVNTVHGCPLPGCSSNENGFRIYTDRDSDEGPQWVCRKCEKYGDGLRLAMLLDDRDPDVKGETRKFLIEHGYLTSSSVKQEVHHEPLPETEPLAPPPLEALPKMLADYASAVAHYYSVDVAMVFAMLIGIAASAIGRAAEIQLKKKWTEIAALWIGIIADAGAGKSPVLKEVTGPVVKHNKALNATHAALVRGWKAECEDLKRDQRPPRPRKEQCIVGDTTIEALANVLEISPQPLSIQDELRAMFDSMGCYKAKGGPDRQNWLSLHNGGDINLNRKNHHNGEGRTIENPRLGIVGCTTPVNAAKLGTDQSGDGLVDRFFFVSVDEQEAEWIDDDDGDLIDGEQEWYDRIAALYALPTVFEDDKKRIIPLSAKAKVVFKDWYIKHRRKARLSVVGYMKGSYVKGIGHCGRIALTLTLLKDPTAAVVDASTVENAICITEWLLAATAHTRQLMFTDFSDGNGVALSDKATSVKRWLERSGRKGTSRQIRRGCTLIGDAEDAEAVCRELQTVGFGGWVVRESAAGRKQLVFILN